MSEKLSNYIDSKVPELIEAGHSEATINRNAQKFKSRILATTSHQTLITAMENQVGGFVVQGNRSDLHLSETVSERALITGDIRKAEKIVDHEAVHLNSAQDIAFEKAGFDIDDYGTLMRHFDLNPKINDEPRLKALSRYLIEGLTEAKSQQQKWADPDCTYTHDEVPATVALVFALQKDCGINLFAQFNARQPLAMAKSLKFYANFLRLRESIPNFRLPVSLS